MEVNGVLPISAQPVQEGQEVTRPNREGGDAVAFAALLYLILGTPQAGISSIAPEEVKADETEASASGVVPSQKDSGALIANSALDSSTRASAWAEGSGSGFSPSGVPESVTRLPGGGQAGLSVGIHGAFTNGSTPKSAAVVVEIDTSIGGGRVDPGAVSEINRGPIEALTAQASAAGQESTVPNDGTSLTREPAAGAPIRVAADEVETDPQVEPGRAPAKFALAEGNVIRRGSVISIEPFDQAQGKPGTRNIEREGTGGFVGRDYAVKIETGPGNVEQPTTTSATGQIVASGKLSNHVEPELVTDPVAKIRPDPKPDGQFQVEITAGAAARLPGRGQGSDSQVHPAQDSEKPTTGTSNPGRLIHGAGKDSTRAEVESVTGPAGLSAVSAQAGEIRADAELTGKFQFGRTGDGGVAEQDAKLMAEADTKIDAPRAGRGPAQRLSDIAVPVPRADIAAEKFAPASDPAPASWRSTVTRVADELASHVRLNKHEAVIQLDPPELGKIKIEMRLDGEKLEARIVAEVHESRELIENHLPELRQALRLQHLDLADVRVSQDPGSGDSGDPMQGFRQQQSDGEPQWARNSENSAAAASASPERSGNEDSAGGIGRVSVWA